MSKKRLEMLLEEHDALFDYYIDVAKEKEQKQNSYVEQINITNQKTGEIFQMQHSLQKKMIEEHNILEQKIGYIHYLAKQQDLTEVFFLTITAPSQYHPFKTISGEKKLNKNFAFDTIKKATQASYRVIEDISRQFYKSLKERLRGSEIDNKLLFVKVNEFHDSFIVHQHLMIMLPKNIKVHSKKRNGKKVSLGVWARAKFYELLKKEDFNYLIHPYRKTNDFKKIVDDGRSISQYMMKYIQKTLSMAKTNEFGSNDTLYFLYGWKTANKIRHYTTSRVPFNSIEYKKLYHILTDTEKNELVARANSNKTNLMTELSKVVSLHREQFEINIAHKRIISKDGNKFTYPTDTEDEHLTKKYQPLASHYPIFTIQSKTTIIKNTITNIQNNFSNKQYDIIMLKDKRVLSELVITRNDKVRYRKSDFTT
ncbi:MAG: replication endonuclease [Sulfurimonas sp.]|nr:replication endonuclease [Sulfurimonas sp.]